MGQCAQPRVDEKKFWGPRGRHDCGTRPLGRGPQPKTPKRGFCLNSVGKGGGGCRNEGDGGKIRHSGAQWLTITSRGRGGKNRVGDHPDSF